MLEEKIVALTTEVVALRKAIEANGTGAAKPAAKVAATDGEKTPAAKKPAAKKPKVVEPEHDADETGTIFRKAAKEDKPACRKYLKSVDCADLAELLTKPELFDGAFEFAEKLLEGDDDDAADDDDDEV